MAAEVSPELPNPVQSAVNGTTLLRKVTIADPLGLHLRPLTAFAKRALQFKSAVSVSKQEVRVNGKSVLELMLLAAPQGSELTLEVTGTDAPYAVEVLAELLAAPGDDMPKKG